MHGKSLLGALEEERESWLGSQVLKPALHTYGLTTAINFESQKALWQNVEEGQNWER